jgi:thioredoxin-dependent peroxiredoxin
MAFLVPPSASLPRGAGQFAPVAVSSRLSSLRAAPRRSAVIHRRPHPVRMVGEGDPTPVFKDVPVTGGGAISSSDLGYCILAFYPKDQTSGCTCEMNDFTRLLPEVEAAGAKVFGISGDSIDSHDKFIAKESIGFPLIADVDGVLAAGFEATKQHPMFGKVINRSSFIIKDGVIVREFRGVSSTGHADEVVAVLKSM